MLRDIILRRKTQTKHRMICYLIY